MNVVRDEVRLFPTKANFPGERNRTELKGGLSENSTEVTQYKESGLEEVKKGSSSP